MNVAVWVERHGRRRPDDPALADGDRVHANWGAMAARTAAAAAGLRESFGLSPGDRVAIVMRNRPEYLEALFAIWHAGLVAVPVNARLHREEIAYILDDSGSAVVVTDDEHADEVEPLVGTVDALQVAVLAPGPRWDRLTGSAPAPLVDRQPGDAAWLFYTSGTTGQPKGATLTHRNLLMASLSYFADIDQVMPQDCILHAAPLSHGSGLYGLPHVARGAVSVVPHSGGVDGDEIAALLARWPGMSLFAAPTMVKRLAGDRAVAAADLAHLKTIIYGGAPMYLADLEDALGRLRSAPGPDLRAGRDADDDHRPVQGGPRRPGPPPVAGAPAERRLSPHRRRGPRRRRRGPRAPRRRGRRGGGPGRRRHGRLLEPARRHRRDAAWRLAAHRRRRQLRRRRVPHAAGPLQGPDHQRRDEHLPPRGRGGAAPPPRRPGRRRRRPARPGVGRGGGRLRGARRRRRAATGEDLDRTCLENIARYKRPKDYRFVDALPTNNYGKVLKRELRDRLRADAPERGSG